MIKGPKFDLTFIDDITKGNVHNVLKANAAIEPVRFYKVIESGEGKVFIMEGAPGSGKSTMCWHICKQWVEGALFKACASRDKSNQEGKPLVEILPYCSGQEAEALKKKAGKRCIGDT
jgi:hypothetical protein